MTIVITRRRVLQAGAVATPLLIVACGDDGAVTPDGGGPRDGGGRDGGTPPTDAGTNPDIGSLNALLSAEYAAVKAYDAGAAILSAPPPGDPFGALAPTALAVAGRFQQQHRDHADVLANAVTVIGGTPIDEASVTFTPPSGFSASVLNVLKLAANAEKAASIAYNMTVQALMQPNHRVIASAIEGDETQHFMVLYAILKGVAAPGPMIASVDLIVPTSFVTTVDTYPGLETVPALPFV